MEISTEIKNNIRYHIVKGVLDIQELTRYLSVIYNSKELDLEIDVFWNLLEADFSSIATEEVRSFKDFVAKHWGTGGDSKAALIVPPDLGYGLARMFEMLMESKSSSKIRVFTSIAEAREWFNS